MPTRVPGEALLYISHRCPRQAVRDPVTSIAPQHGVRNSAAVAKRAHSQNGRLDRRTRLRALRGKSTHPACSSEALTHDRIEHPQLSVAYPC
eukprot:scaffold45278_cov472-Isochrysis_galbana.AAC.1